MFGEIVFHLIFCTIFCSIVHYFFHQRTHTKHELTKNEVAEIRAILHEIRNNKVVSNSLEQRLNALAED